MRHHGLIRHLRPLRLLAALLAAGLAGAAAADSQSSIPQPITPPVPGALYDGFSRIVANGGTIAAFHTDNMGHFTTTLELAPGVYQLFPDCRGGEVCGHLRMKGMTAAHLPGPGKSAPAQRMDRAFSRLDIDTRQMGGVVILRFTGVVERDPDGTDAATLMLKPKGGFTLIPGSVHLGGPGKDHGGGSGSGGGGQGGSTGGGRSTK